LNAQRRGERDSLLARILIVDDEKNIAETTAAMLTQCGHETAVCLSLAEAHEYLRATEVDCVVVDVVLPDGNGVDFLGAVRGQRPGLAAVVVTGHLMAATAEKVALLPGVQVLDKPFRLRELVERVEGALNAAS